MSSIFSVIFSSILKYKKQKTNDIMGVYPGRVHVCALPERRYLKTSRVMALIALMSIAGNFALAFVYMDMASSVSSMIATPLSAEDTIASRMKRRTYLYRIDPYHQKIKQIELAESFSSSLNLMVESLIEEHILMLYSVVPSYEIMEQRFSPTGKMALSVSEGGGTILEQEKVKALNDSKNGITRKVYIYFLQRVNTNLFEVIFDVFSFDKNVNGYRVCRCLEKDDACLTCLREESQNVTRHRVFLRYAFNAQLNSTQRKQYNPFLFNIYMYADFIVPIHNNDMWTDVDRIL